ncbi:MAG: hypothetical protein HY905_21665 [Deltaproteobacteria bacterium]|nr:hypothetical protein [Deltaproteobacteria bacterium]
MKKMGKTLARAGLAVLTATMGFVIAACYGAMYAFQGGGRVVDARSQQGVAGARVDCRQGGQSIANTETAADGSYDFGSYPCDEVMVQDGGGRYRPQTVPARPDGATYVELEGTK